jgi:hypothetical protein
MTEREWVACQDPDRMLALLIGRASDRKLRLLACACCREALRLSPARAAARGVRVAERAADGAVAETEVAAAAAALEVLLLEAEQDRRGALADYEGDAGSACGCPDCDALAFARGRERNPAADPELGYRALEASAAAEVAGLAAEAVLHALAPSCWREAITAARAVGRQAGTPIEPRVSGLVREVVGNPFRTPPPGPGPYQAGGVIGQLARAVYEEGAFERLPVLADALEEVGCTDAQLLGHLRGPGPHARGCWALDFLLGKE